LAGFFALLAEVVHLPPGRIGKSGWPRCADRPNWGGTKLPISGLNAFSPIGAEVGRNRRIGKRFATYPALCRVPDYAEKKASQSLRSNRDSPSRLCLLGIIRQELRGRRTECSRGLQGGQSQNGGHLRSPQQRQGRAVELAVAFRDIRIELPPADYAEIVALPIPSICGRGEFPRHNPELGIRPVMPSSA
jgi:hypothetical protein